jgi:hypothetical protein
MTPGRALLIVLLPVWLMLAGAPAAALDEAGWRVRTAAVVQGYNEGRYRRRCRSPRHYTRRPAPAFGERTHAR